MTRTRRCARSTPPGRRRARAWEPAGGHAPDRRIDAGNPLTVDVDATLVTRSQRQGRRSPTFKKGFGHHPLWAFVDHGGTGNDAGTGEPLSVLLRPVNAGSNTAADHITVIREALRQLPGHPPGTQDPDPDRLGRVHPRAAGVDRRGQRLSYSVGFNLPDTRPAAPVLPQTHRPLDPHDRRPTRHPRSTDRPAPRRPRLADANRMLRAGSGTMIRSPLR
ncbi:transposase [Pseudonocardia sp. DSM 110487]|nr:transposase [Pseudonocardia sp. DSM 110487]